MHLIIEKLIAHLRDNSETTARCKPRIIEGQVVAYRNWPMQVFLASKNQTSSNYQVCGGTIIDEEFVLTAAHCVAIEGKSRKILAGRLNLAQYEPGDQEREVVRAIRHPNYKLNSISDDIALVKLDRPLDYSKTVYPARLPARNHQLPLGVKVTLTGYGRVKHNQTTHLLHELSAVTSSCGSHRYLVTQNIICTIDPSGSGGRSCRGDSGGPLLWRHNRWWTVVGVNAFGKSTEPICQDAVSGFTKVSAYVDWIHQTMAENR